MDIISIHNLPVYWWSNDKPKWHHVTIDGQEYWPLDKLNEILNWMEINIDNPKRHCRWRMFQNYLEFKFRYERDVILFKLSW